ncbi:MAG: quinol:electron acceptor oxidoreductase subunit ActD, partial [Ginsengibacter sp.]
MSVKKFVVGCFDDEKVLFPAVKNVRRAGYKIHDVYTPFPVHGMDHAIGIRETSIHTAGFIYGITGTATALTCMGWIFT